VAAFPGKCYHIYVSTVCMLCVLRQVPSHDHGRIFGENWFFFCRLELHILFPLLTLGCRVHTNTAQINIPFCIYICVCINNINTVTLDVEVHTKFWCNAALFFHFFFSRRLFVRVASYYVFLVCYHFTLQFCIAHIYIYIIFDATMGARWAHETNVPSF